MQVQFHLCSNLERSLHHEMHREYQLIEKSVETPVPHFQLKFAYDIWFDIAVYMFCTILGDCETY